MRSGRTRVLLTLTAIVLIVSIVVVLRYAPGSNQPPVDEPVGENVDLHGDPLPPGAVARLGTIRFRTGGGTGLVFVDGGERIVTGFGQRRIAVFDATTGRRERILRGHRESIRDPAQPFDPVAMLLEPGYGTRDDVRVGLAPTVDGRSVYSLGLTLRRWDLDSGAWEVLLELDGIPHEGPAVSPDGSLIAFADAAGIHLYDVADRRDRVVVPVSRRPASKGLSFSPDGRLLAWSGLAGSAGVGSVLELGAGTRPREVGTVQGYVLGLEFAADHALWMCGYVGPIRAWSPEGTLLHTLQRPSQPSWPGVTVSPDGAVLALGWSHDDAARVALHRTEDGSKIAELGPLAGMVTGLRFSPGAERLAVNLTGNSIVMIDVAERRVITPLTGHVAPVRALAVSPCGERAATLGHRGALRVWDTSTGAALLSIPLGSFSPLSAAFSPDGTRLRATLRHENTDVEFVEWDRSSGDELRREPVPRGVDWAQSFTALLDGSGEFILCAGSIQPGKQDEATTQNGVLLVRDADSMSPIRSYRDVPSRWPLADISSLGRHVHWYDARILVASVREPGPPLALPLGRFQPGAVAVSPRGDHAVVVGRSEAEELRLRIWALPSGELRSDVEVDEDRASWRRASTLAFGPDGSVVASGGPDHAVRVWSVPDGDLLATFEGHLNGINALAFTPDGRRLVSASSDTTALVWDLTDVIESR